MGFRFFGDAEAQYGSAFKWLNSAGTFSVGFVGPASITASVVWTLPTTDSTGTQAMVSDGAGTLSWAAATSGTVTSVGVAVPAWLSATAAITTSGNITLAVAGSAAGALLVGAGATSASWLAVPTAKRFLTISASNIVAWSTSASAWTATSCGGCRSVCCSPTAAEIGDGFNTLVSDLQALGILS